MGCSELLRSLRLESLVQSSVIYSANEDQALERPKLYDPRRILVIHSQGNAKKEDFKAPAGIDVEALRGMIASGALTTQFHVTFEEQRLGMMLADADDENGVEVVAFTEYEGELGPAELGGDIQMSDKVIRVNGDRFFIIFYGNVDVSFRNDLGQIDRFDLSSI